MNFFYRKSSLAGNKFFGFGYSVESPGYRPRRQTELAIGEIKKSKARCRQKALKRIPH